MSFVSAIVALVIEQYRPLNTQRWINAPLQKFFAYLDLQFNDGQYRHGVVAWMFGVLVPSLLVMIVCGMLSEISPLAAMALTILVLYLTMGFRQFSHHFTAVQSALRATDVESARHKLAAWRGISEDRLSSNDIARIAIEQALLASYRHVFGPLIVFAVLGPGGAVLFRLSTFASSYWQERSDVSLPDGAKLFGKFSHQALHVLNWLPTRLTAIGFAITADFEDAVFCWRTQAMQWPHTEEGILLSSGAGALGVRLGLPIHTATGVEDRLELGLGDDADPDYLQSATGMVWRTLLLGILLMALIWVASWMG